jgi:hypothetical protein
LGKVKTQVPDVRRNAACSIKTQLSSPPLAKTATFVTGLILTIDGTSARGFPQADPRDLQA